ncbi:MAG: PEP-CTERM sorting domain-containing protein [Fimbriimonadaceae bacterium]|nr:PEP-CTERM sorting domain-containing protein [Chthonomonadaceae bacterium]MCO5295872.1 PEP-CTERM sorting domain-containing protein [Fimbriimonadaceae bacterium]
MRKTSLLALFVVAVPFAGAQSITTLYAANNQGNLGGAAYFDVTVGSTALTVTGFDTNTIQTVAFDFSVYTRNGAGIGNETAGDWTLVATGSGVGLGTNNPSAVTLNNTFTLSANTLTGMALVMGPQAQHTYTNGTGANQDYSNADLALHLGSTSNVPFTAPTFNPRVWNGTIYYTPVPEPATMAILGLGVLPLLRRKRK